MCKFILRTKTHLTEKQVISHRISEQQYCCHGLEHKSLHVKLWLDDKPSRNHNRSRNRLCGICCCEKTPQTWAPPNFENLGDYENKLINGLSRILETAHGWLGEVMWGKCTEQNLENFWYCEKSSKDTSGTDSADRKNMCVLNNFSRQRKKINTDPRILQKLFLLMRCEKKRNKGSKLIPRSWKKYIQPFSWQVRASKRLPTVSNTSLLLENRWKTCNWPSIIMRMAAFSGCMWDLKFLHNYSSCGVCTGM
jgi:hypothetical protein